MRFRLGNLHPLPHLLQGPIYNTGVHLTARLQQAGNSPGDASAGAQGTSAAAQTKLVEIMLGVLGYSVTVDREKGNAIDLQITTLAFDSKRKAVASQSQALAASFKPKML